MNREIVELEEHFQRLRSSRSSLSAEMRVTACALRQTGQVPGLELQQSLDDYRDLFGRFRSRLGLEESAGDIAWNQLDARMTLCLQASAALATLKSIERLQIPLGLESTLVPVQQAYQDVIQRLTLAPWNEAELTDVIQWGRHPLRRLLSLIERLYELTDDEWSSEMTVMQQVFGIAVATAIARGKLTLDSAASNE